MLTATQLLAFLLAAVLVTITPGPDNLMVLGLGMSRGRRQGIAFGLGCALGCLSHTALAVLGVSALIAASPVAFTALKWIGGAYLMWLGLQALRSGGATNVGEAAGTDGETSGTRDSLRGFFLKGVFANAINPKVVLFFLSFLPQFVVPAQGNVRCNWACSGSCSPRRRQCSSVCSVTSRARQARGYASARVPAYGWTALPARCSSCSGCGW